MNQWQLLAERFARLQQREKWLLSGSILLLTLWLAVNYMLEPLWKANRSMQQQIQQVQRQLTDSAQQVQQLRLQLSADQDAGYRQRIAELEQQQQQLNEQIRQNASHFIGAEQMVALLHNMLQSSSGVQIIRLSSAAPQPVRLAGQAASEPALLYQHKLTLVMSGSYARLHQVLGKMEQLPWLINWAGLHYQVKDYPAGEMSLELITVSEHEDIIRL